MDKPTRGGKRPGAGRKPIAPTSATISLSITLTHDDIAYLETINPKNLSAAIRSLIAAARSG